MDENANVNAPSNAAAPPPPAPAAGSSAGFKRLHKFLWGGVMIVIGSLLPFGSAVTSSMIGDVDKLAAKGPDGQEAKRRLEEIAESLGTGELAARAAERAEAEAAAADDSSLRLPARRAYETFSGALFLLIGALLILQMREAIAERKVILGGVLLALFPCGWTWFKWFTVVPAIPGFSWGELYRLAAWERLSLDVGTGFLVVWIGSTYVTLQFLKALGAALTGGKKTAGSSARGASGGSGRSRRR